MNFTIKELNELIYSLGTTATKGFFCDKELNASLLDRLYDELKTKIEAEDEGPEFDSAGFSKEDRYPHFVSNEEADEDALTLKSDRFNGVTQFILDFVESSPSKTASFRELNDAYRAYTNGSNSLSHILSALQIPYKNRPTRRYLNKLEHGLYEVKIATPQNWVEATGNYRTFNEAPYSNN